MVQRKKQKGEQKRGPRSFRWEEAAEEKGGNDNVRLMGSYGDESGVKVNEAKGDDERV